jgi:AhpD family alkylhydroperoxidase
VTSRNDIHSETDARQRGTTGDLASSSEPDRSTVAVDVCVPRRFASADEAARDAANVLVRGPLVTHAYAGGLDSQLRERIMVAVSQVNACGGCTRVHRRWALRAGVSSAELEALRTGDLEHLDPRSRAAVSYAVDRAELRFEGPASPGIERSASEHLSVTELNEVDAIARAMALANLSLNTLAAAKLPSATGAAQHPVFARVWSHISGKVGSDKQRSELLAGLRGRVLEVGAGDGRNFAHYPPEVSEVLAVEPEPYLRRLAADAAGVAPVPVTVFDGTAELLPHEDGVFDSVVSSLVLCSVIDQEIALAELHRVLTPGGELRFFEHVIAGRGLGKAVQAGLDGSGVWPHLGAGCHLARDTVGAIAAAGFKVERVRRFTSGPGPLGIPFVLGTARRRSALP